MELECWALDEILHQDIFDFSFCERLSVYFISFNEEHIKQSYEMKPFKFALTFSHSKCLIKKLVRCNDS